MSNYLTQKYSQYDSIYNLKRTADCIVVISVLTRDSYTLEQGQQQIEK